MSFFFQEIITEAVVVANESQLSSSSKAIRKVYFPTLEYKDSRGKKIRSKLSQGSSDWEFEIGHKVEVRVDPQNPQAVMIHDVLGMWGLPVGLMIVGAAGAALGAVTTNILARAALGRALGGARGAGTP